MARYWLCTLAVYGSSLLPLASLADPQPDMHFSGSHRLRYESLQNGPRPDSPDSDELLVSRLLASLQLQYGSLTGQIELQDSRAWLDGPLTPLGTDDVNTLEPLQAWIGWSGSDQLPLEIRAGRMTKEWRTRRLVARNRFRNTINSFQGLDAQWSGTQWSINAFALSAMDRKPAARERLASNEWAIDHPNAGQRFWGLEVRPQFAGDWSVYALRLTEDQPTDGRDMARRLTTLGGEWQTSLPRSHWAHRGEVAIQLGEQQTANGPALDHEAWFAHVQLERAFPKFSQGVFTVSLDYASGDQSDPDTFQRFDTLFGARRFEYGPSGIYATNARRNQLSHEVRGVVQPAPGFELMAAWRGFWLAQPTDVQSGTQYRQPAEKSSRHVGQQLETRLRWDAHPQLQLETGAAWLDKGSVLSRDDFASPDNTLYLYVASTLRW